MAVQRAADMKKLIKHHLCTLQDCIECFFICLLWYQHWKQYSPLLLENGVLLSVILKFLHSKHK